MCVFVELFLNGDSDDMKKQKLYFGTKRTRPKPAWFTVIKYWLGSRHLTV